jgi:hypothetical protein
MWKKLNEKLFKTKRTTIWIVPDSQTQFIWDLVKHYVLILFVFIFFAYMPPFAGMFSIHSVEAHQSAFRDFVAINQAKWPLWLVLALVFVFYAVMISHRIFGPLFKLRSYLEQDQNESLSYPLSFREGDYHGSLPEVINGYRQSQLAQKEQILLELQQLAEKYPQDSQLQALIQKLS